MNLLLGVDVGGTKTHALLRDEETGSEALGLGPGGNWEATGMEGMLESLRIAISQAAETLGLKKLEPQAAAFGLAGLDWESDLEPLTGALQTLDLGCPFTLLNDGVLPLWTATLDGYGIAVSAGTGNNVRGRWHHGRTGRITGNSVRNGEFGGGSELVFLAIQRLSHIWTMRAAAETELVPLFCQETGAKDLADLLEGLIRNRYHLQAGVAEQIVACARRDDPVALEVVRHNLHELALSVVGVHRQLQIGTAPFALVMSGSLLVKSNFYQQQFMDALHPYLPRAQALTLSEPPVRGAINVARALLA